MKNLIPTAFAGTAALFTLLWIFAGSAPQLEAAPPTDPPTTEAPTGKGTGAPGDEAKPAAPATAEVNDPRFHPRLLEIAASYRKYHLADDAIRWAPTLCWAPTPKARMSAAKEKSPHGRKLYFLYAKRRNEYVSLGRKKDPPAIPRDQVVVKQSWHPKPAAAHRITHDADAYIERQWTAEADGKIWDAARQGPLFILYRDEKAPAESTDEGWVYGTVTPDGKSVTSAGRVASCMACHEKADHHRLFGLPRD